ncbi:MAG: hypothetical protein AAGA96_20530 [Verrucomicrobiota bacterium]
MNRIFTLSFLALAACFFTACQTNNAIQVGGVPEWMMGGATLDDEPAPMPPDPAMIDFRNESGPIEFFMMTDVRNYPLAPKKRVTKTKEIEYERGRDYRIKRLFY